MTRVLRKNLQAEKSHVMQVKTKFITKLTKNKAKKLKEMLRMSQDPYRPESERQREVRRDWLCSERHKKSIVSKHKILLLTSIRVRSRALSFLRECRLTLDWIARNLEATASQLESLYSKTKSSSAPRED